MFALCEVPVCGTLSVVEVGWCANVRCECLGECCPCTMEPDSSMAVVRAAPVEVGADVVASEAGSGGCRDVMSVMRFATMRAMGTGSDYRCTSGDISE